MRLRRIGRSRLGPWWLLGVLLFANRPALAAPETGVFEPGKGRGVRTSEAAEVATEPTPVLAALEPASESADETTDPELRALLEVDQSLFPEPLAGVQPGFSFGSDPLAGLGAPRPPLAVPLLRDVFPQVEQPWLARVAMPNFPTRMDARVVRYLKFYRDDPRGQAIIQMFAKKSGRYTPALKARVLRAGLPTDLVWLSLIESGHNPTIRSRVGAAGLWQFMPATAIHYGLAVDRYVDERLDPEKSTLAAITFLTELKQRFGNWELAMAAYNMGLGALGEAISKFNCNDFWELSRYEAGLPWETTLYVPKIVAMGIVMNNPEVFGISALELDAAERFETVRVLGGTTLAQVAYAAGVTSKSISALNPQYLRGKLPPFSAKTKRLWPVHVPVGTGGRAQAKLGKLSDGAAALATVEVKLGDTAASIANARRIQVGELRSTNGLGPNEELAVGDVLWVPPVVPSKAAPPEVPEVVTSPRNFTYLSRERVFYPVRGDETLAEIAAAFETSVDELVAWNSLDETARLQPKMVLQVFMKKSKPVKSVRFLREKDVTVLTAGTAAFYDYHEAQKGRRRVMIAANAADTLAAIARKYGMSEGLIERVNRRGRKEALVPGEPVVVYVDKKLARLSHELFGSRVKKVPELTTPPPLPGPIAQRKVDQASLSGSRSD